MGPNSVVAVGILNNDVDLLAEGVLGSELLGLGPVGLAAVGGNLRRTAGP